MPMLPADLRSAEAQALAAVLAALPRASRGRWTVEWRFEGLRILPVALRLAEALISAGQQPRLLFADAGAAALARRDAAALAERIDDLRNQLRRQQAIGAATDSDVASEVETESSAPELLLAVAPAQPEYLEFEQMCQAHPGTVVILNGSLEDAAVGIGSVARQRRRGFLAEWQPAYALQPLEERALRFAYPGPWELYRRDPDGYRLAARFDEKPDLEAQLALLASDRGSGVAAGLRSLDAFIEGLRN
jgi:hypothetical protein